MGFWKQLFGIEPIPQPVKHLSQKPPVRNPPPVMEEGISEPVLSIIQTLKNGEWSFKSIAGYRSDVVYFTHERFGHELVVYNFHYSEGPECRSEWMTQDEKEAVGSVCWQIYRGRVKWEKEQSFAKQRESFMNLTGEY